jgi:uncharacterized protein (DUF2252 family)
MLYVRNVGLPPINNETIDSESTTTNYSNKSPALSKTENMTAVEKEISDQVYRSRSSARARNTLSTKIIKDLLDERLAARSRVGSDPEAAVKFVVRYNQRLGLSESNLKTRYELMKKDAFSFYRINPALFFSDIKDRYVSGAALLDRPAPRIVINGDPHLLNFGTFRGPEKDAVWGLNDYDQADIGSPEWDLERLATSAVLMARFAGLDAKAEKQIVEDIGKKYFDTISDIAEGRESGNPFLTEAESEGPIKDLIELADNKKRKDFLKNYVEALPNGKYRFIRNDEIRPISSSMAKALSSSLAEYEKNLGPTDKAARPLKILALAEKLGSGGSSFGLKRYYALAANENPGKEPVILELKQLLTPSVNDQSGNLSAADGKNVVERQRMLGGNVNTLTGYTRINGQAFLVRELEPEKSRLEPEQLETVKDLEQLAKQAGQVLARSHGHLLEQAEAIEQWVGDDRKKAIKRLVSFARKYADQIDADYRAFKASV